MEERLEQIELDFYPKGRLPGTSLTRTLDPGGDGVTWCLAVGIMDRAKMFFYGKDVDDLITRAFDVLYSSESRSARKAAGLR